MFGEFPTQRGPVAGTFAFVRAVRRWRWWQWALFNLGLLTVVFAAYLHFSSPPPAISVESYERIRIGMTWREVHDIVRARPGGYGLYWAGRPPIESGNGKPVREDRWGAAYGVLEVGYDADGRVCRKVLYHPLSEVVPHPENWPWWRRLTNRSVPDASPAIVFSPF
jgi:hypothetical protein